MKKFEQEQCAASWMTRFESELERFAVVLDGDKIRAMKLFLGESPAKWYEYKETFLEADDWDEWKASFLKAFGANGWDQIREAHRFKIKGGSFTDYACKKVKLLVDEDPKLEESTLVSLIVIGIPIRYQERIKKQEVETVDDLMAILNTFPPLTAQWNQPDKPENKKNNSGEWKKNKPWNKSKKPEANQPEKDKSGDKKFKKQVNLIATSSEDSDEESSQKKSDCAKPSEN